MDARFVRLTSAATSSISTVRIAARCLSGNKELKLLSYTTPWALRSLSRRTKGAYVQQENPYILRENGCWIITEEGSRLLADITTDPEGPVYAFTEKASPLLVGAAMARLSRRGDDLRITYLDEFAHTDAGRAEGLVRRVVTQYGDDSVQQLLGLHVVVEGASNLLTKLIEWSRLAAYLEQSTRYIYFDEKDHDGRYKYFVPANLRGHMRGEYVHTMDKIFTLYSKIVRELAAFVRKRSEEPADKKERGAWLGATRAQACDAARMALPAATKSTVGVFASAQAIEQMAVRLAAHPLQEARDAASAMLREARKVMPVFFERADMPERGGAISAYRAVTDERMRWLARSLLHNRAPSNLMRETEAESVTLVDYWPEDELELVPGMLFAPSHRPLAELKREVRDWPRETKEKVFQAYMGERLNRRHKPGRALERAHYEWEILGDYGSFRDIQRHRMVDEMEWQELTTGHGYATPALVREAGLAHVMEECFSLSARLYGKMCREGFAYEAQYATLFGHLMRYRFIENAREAFHLHELRTAPQGHPSYRRIVNKMHAELARVHPRIAAAMRFVNKDEDPELTRMAAELAAQHKLELALLALEDGDGS